MTYFTEKEDKFIIENYDHLDKKTFLNNLNRSWVSIKHRAKKLGLSRPNIRLAKLKKLIDKTVENAYWLGFIMADGHITDRGELKITLSSEDERHLVELANYLGYDVHLHKQPCVNLTDFHVMDRINGLRLKQTLQIDNKKTYNPPKNFDFLTTPDEKLAFFIGFVDGDGNLTYLNETFKSIRIVVHGNWYDWWKSFCDDLSIHYPNLRFTVNNTNQRHNTTVYVGTKETRRFLLEFINKHNLKILKRKWKPNIN